MEQRSGPRSLTRRVLGGPWCGGKRGCVGVPRPGAAPAAPRPPTPAWKPDLSFTFRLVRRKSFGEKFTAKLIHVTNVDREPSLGQAECREETPFTPARQACPSPLCRACHLGGRGEAGGRPADSCVIKGGKHHGRETEGAAGAMAEQRTDQGIREGFPQEVAFWRRSEELSQVNQARRIVY